MQLQMMLLIALLFFTLVNCRSSSSNSSSSSSSSSVSSSSSSSSRSSVGSFQTTKSEEDNTQVQKCSDSHHLTLIMRGFDYAEAILDLTDPDKHDTCPQIPLLFVGSFAEIGEASRTILPSIFDAKQADDGRSIGIGLLMDKKWIKKHDKYDDWPEIIANIRKEFKKLTRMSLRVILYEGEHVPVALKHAIEDADLFGIHRDDIKNLSRYFKKHDHVNKKKHKRRLIKSLKKHFSAENRSIFLVNFSRHPKIDHLKAVKRAVKTAKKELVDLSTCIRSREPRIPISRPSRPQINTSYRPANY